MRTDRSRATGRRGESLTPSGRRNPCPICGRAKDGDCRIRSDLAICHHGASHHPPEGLRPGDVIDGNDGRRWAYTKESDDGRGAVFTLDKPKDNGSRREPSRRSPRPSRRSAPPPRVTLARLPDGTELPVPNRDRATYQFSDGQQIRRDRRPDGGKRIRPFHRIAGAWKPGAGPDPWPLYRQQDLTRLDGGWPVEAEGEHCADLLAAAGLVGTSQPGHDRSAEAIERRYRDLKAAGCPGLVYLSDHDTAGIEKAHKAAAAAAAAGLPFLHLPAVEVWPGLPSTASIDDAPGSPDEHRAALEAAVAAGRARPVEPEQQDEARTEQAPEPKRRGEDTPEQKLARVREIAAELLEARTPYGDRVPLLRHKAADLGLQLRDGEILRLFVEARRTGTPEAVEAGEVVRGETAPWLVEGLFLAGTLNLIVAPPKVGKTTLVLGMIAAWRQRRSTFIGQPLSRADVPPVLIVGTDQPEADWCKGLRDFGLLDAGNRLAHPITALYHRGRPIHLDDEGVERIAMRAAEQEGLLILCDSLSALTAPLGIREETPEIAAPVQALMEAVTPYGATVVLIHHANKSRLDRTGVASSRGSTALPAMASQIVNLAWASGDESEEDRRVRLTTAGRAGADLDLLIERDGNEWACLGSGAEVAAERRRAEEERKLNDRQDDVLEIVRERWNEKQERTTAQHVVEALRIGGADPSRIARRTLKQLETRGLLESISRSTTTASIVEFWPKGVRTPGLSPNPVRTVRTVRTSPPSHVDSDEVLIPNPFPPRGSDRFGQFGQAGEGGGSSDTLSGHPPEGSDTLDLEPEWESPDRLADTQRERRIWANPAAVEQADADQLWELQHARRTAQQVDPFATEVEPSWLPDLRRLLVERPQITPPEAALALDPGSTGRPIGRDVRPWLDRLRAEQQPPAHGDAEAA